MGTREARKHSCEVKHSPGQTPKYNQRIHTEVATQAAVQNLVKGHYFVYMMLLTCISKRLLLFLHGCATFLHDCA